MTDTGPLSEILSDSKDLATALEDHNVRHIVITTDGTWTYFKLGRVRPGPSKLDESWMTMLAQRISTDEASLHNEWAIRRFRGRGGSSFLLERLPTSVLERLPGDVITGLETQIRRDGNGLIVGKPGTSKASLLLWLALKIPDETVLFVSENPPTELPGRHILHVYPPENSAQRRHLERLARLNQTVMWDRIAGPDDIHTLFGFAGARRRWFSLDASSIRSALRALSGYMSQGVDARFDAVLSLDASIIGRPEVLNFLTLEDGGWQERFCREDSGLQLMKVFSRRGFEALGSLAQRSESQVSESTKESPTVEPPGLGEESSMAGIRKRPGGHTIDFENPLTVPVEPGDAHYEHPNASADSRDPSGEIDLKGFVDQRAAQNLPEDTRQYDTLKSRINEAHTSTTDSALLRDILPEMVEDPDRAVNLADLRITRAEDYDQDALRKIRDSDTSNVDYEAIPSDALQPIEDDDFLADFELDDAIDEAWSEASYAEEDDYSSVFEDDYVPTDEGDDQARTAVAGAHDYTLDSTFRPDLDTSPTRAAGVDLSAAIAAAQQQARVDPDSEDEATAEITIDDAVFLRRASDEDK